MGRVQAMIPRRKQPEQPPDTEDSDSPFAGPVVVPIEDSIDLHAFSPKEIPSVVEEYIAQCIQAGIYEVRIIHGRGTGVQREIVRSLLEKHPPARLSKTRRRKREDGARRWWH